MGHEHRSETFSEPRTTDYCMRCGESPESGSHTLGKCEYADPREPHPDPVNHPPHYNFGKFEVIDVIEDWQLGFHLGNAVKYIARAGRKGNALEDLKKARWYLEREIERRSK